jgi:hypothetical protein
VATLSNNLAIMIDNLAFEKDNLAIQSTNLAKSTNLVGQIVLTKQKTFTRKVFVYI